MNGMARYDASNAECLVFSYKEGLLSKLAHDLKIKAERFSIDVDEDTGAITASFDPASLQPVCAQVDGRDDPRALSAGDKKKIYANITKDVLHSKKHPEVTFISSSVEKRDGGYRVTGELQLHGQRRAIHADVLDENRHWVTEVPIYQPDFGIKPFTAALGALKIKPGVKVQIRVPQKGPVG